MTAISVIIPVYNVAPYITGCIGALKTQCFRDLEFIFVDDCSTDKSRAAVEEFARTDPRVRISRNRENIGPGLSRNRGIETADGDYLSFIDPDDSLAPDFYQLLYEKAVSGDFDIVKGSRVKVDPVSGKRQPEKVNELIRTRMRQGEPLYFCFKRQHTTAIFRKCLFEDKRIRYGTGRSAEDTTFLLSVCKKTENIAFADPAIYYYHVRPGSRTSLFTEQRCRDELKSFSEKVDLLCLEKTDPFTVRYLENALSSYVSNICQGMCEGLIPEETEMDFVSFLREQLFRIPAWTQCKKSEYESSVLMDHQRLIPMINVKPRQFHCDRVRRWTDLLTACPETEAGYLLTGYDHALLHALSSFLLHDPKSFFFSRNHFVFIKEQLARLSPELRKQLIRNAGPAVKKLLAKLRDRMRYGTDFS